MKKVNGKSMKRKHCMIHIEHVVGDPEGDIGDGVCLKWVRYQHQSDTKSAKCCCKEDKCIVIL